MAAKILRWRLLGFLVLGLMICPQRFCPAANHSEHGPRLVMIIRHAEKPEDGPDLSPKGYQRADALATVIPDHFPRPDFLFATKKSKSSNRPVETITPLSTALHEAIDSKYKTDDVDQLAKAVLDGSEYEGKVVLICWHHEKIPALAKAFGVTDAPDKWNSSVFDRVWEITYDGKTATFANVPQKALPGDSQK